MHFIWWRGYYNHAWVSPYTHPTLPVSLTVVQSQLNVCPHIFRKALFIPLHTRMYQCCTSTYWHRSHSHFNSNQAPLGAGGSWRRAGGVQPNSPPREHHGDPPQWSKGMEEQSIQYPALEQHELFQKQGMYQYVLSTYQYDWVCTGMYQVYTSYECKF